MVNNSRVTEFLNKRTNKKIKRSNPSKNFTEYSRSELVSILIENDFRSASKITKFRNSGNLNVPPVCKFVKVFGSWQEAKEEAFGKKEYKDDIDFIKETTEGLLKNIAAFNLNTKKKYESKHKAHPNIIPSYYVLTKRLGIKHWKDIYNLASNFSIHKLLFRIVGFTEKLGRLPTKDECDKEKIDYSKILDFFGSRKELKQSVNMILRRYNSK